MTESVFEHEENAPSLFAADWRKLMMWIFLINDALLFTGFLGAYGFIRLSSRTWPHPSEVFSMPLVTAMTIILIFSSATMASAVEAARRADRKRTILFLLLTILGGLFFLGSQAFEWTTLIREGARLSTNPWNVPLFSAFFFVITGFHGSHVLSGVIILAIVAIRRSGAAGVELAGLFWHFVDLVWVFIFTFFYLL
jgi:cytochrome c oxidase subunit 3